MPLPLALLLRLPLALLFPLPFSSHSLLPKGAAAIIEAGGVAALLNVKSTNGRNEVFGTLQRLARNSDGAALIVSGGGVAMLVNEAAEGDAEGGAEAAEALWRSTCVCACV